MSYCWCGIVAAESRLRKSVHAISGPPRVSTGSGDAASSSCCVPAFGSPSRLSVTLRCGPKLPPPFEEAREKTPQS